MFLILLNKTSISLWKILFDTSFSSKDCFRLYNSSDMNLIISDFISLYDSMYSFDIDKHSDIDEEFFNFEMNVFVFILENLSDILFLILSIFESSFYILILHLQFKKIKIKNSMNFIKIKI